ncbi:hypothetical protein TraAM80_02158 [Trypanosoma rangeli]|uniref:Uncharacterized protein n=1 Tax=Trypanosoma rangeli TaxID=5698 RepID=A0A3S5IS00_TRYRA|nr:uncharacterized protein TraAM80_02158 [Trypanosoma rangeli]RNF09447.1 hypothetical protein TraAM80_02158 [Trypanosoma rangeli]|eukprot:RNF09447.1 hypothetical protein TraAM80_02158 [Trypanosoma rangeli]
MGKRRRSCSLSSTRDASNNNTNTNNLDGEALDASCDEGETLCESTQPLGVFLWRRVNMVLYTSMLKQLHYTCGVVAIERSWDTRRVIIHDLNLRLVAFWEAETATLAATERERLSGVFHSHLNAMIERFSSLAVTDMRGGDLCRAFLQALDVFGFPEEENMEEALLVSAMRKSADPHAYSYHKRTSHKLGVLPRYDGDRRTEDQHRLPRLGRVVQLPSPHPHSEVNTEIQLIEPKKRRPPLDENRIFLHPKKATSSGMEDILVDEELRYRALVVLGRHLDTFASLQHLSPFVRFLLWDTLGRDDEVFERLTASPTDNEELLAWQQDHLESLRRLVAEKRAVFDVTRAAARETALRIGWCAVSAHWRDQVLRTVEVSEDADWFLLRATAKTGSKAIFPNYALSTVIKDIALKALRRVRDGHVDCGVEDAVECYRVITDVLFPLLEGTAPCLPGFEASRSPTTTAVSEDENCGAGEPQSQQAEEAEEEGDEELKKRVAALMVERTGSVCSDAEVARGVRWCLDCESLLPRKGSTCAFVSDMFVWPLQCLASLLELIAVTRHSVDGIKKFAASFLPSNWGDQESVLEFLLRREPTNIPLASLVGFPRLVRDVFVSAQWLRNDKYCSVVVECRRQACALPSGAAASNFIQWRALATMLSRLNYSEDVFAVTVHEMPPDAAEQGKLWTVAELECTPKTWVEGLALMLTAAAAPDESST